MSQVQAMSAVLKGAAQATEPCLLVRTENLAYIMKIKITSMMYKRERIIIEYHVLNFHLHGVRNNILYFLHIYTVYE